MITIRLSIIDDRNKKHYAQELILTDFEIDNDINTRRIYVHWLLNALDKVVNKAKYSISKDILSEGD